MSASDPVSDPVSGSAATPDAVSDPAPAPDPVDVPVSSVPVVAAAGPPSAGWSVVLLALGAVLGLVVGFGLGMAGSDGHGPRGHRGVPVPVVVEHGEVPNGPVPFDVPPGAVGEVPSHSGDMPRPPRAGGAGPDVEDPGTDSAPRDVDGDAPVRGGGPHHWFDDDGAASSRSESGRPVPAPGDDVAPAGS